MAVKSWKRASWRESVVELGVQRIADQQSAIIIGGLGKEEKKGASKGGAEGQRERDREVGERGQKKKGERKGENGEREREREGAARDDEKFDRTQRAQCTVVHPLRPHDRSTP